MSKLLISLAFVPALFAAGYKSEPAGAPPSDVPSAYQAMLGTEGFKVTGPNGVLGELWFRKELPTGGPSSMTNVSLPTVPQGALIGVLHLAVNHQDRRGQKLVAGFYTLRHSLYPVNGDHQGVSPQRDFLLLTPLAEDPDPAATPDYPTLVKASLKASKTPHPAALSYWKEDAGNYKGGMVDLGESEWVLQVKLGETLLSVMLAGVYVN